MSPLKVLGPLVAGALLGLMPGPATAQTPDFDKNGRVDFDDFFLFATGYGKVQGGAGFNGALDLSGDGRVDSQDFFLFASNFGRSGSSIALAPLTSPGTNAGAKLAAALDKATGVAPGGKVTLTVRVTGATGLTGYVAEVLYDPNALADPVGTGKLAAAVSLGAISEPLTGVTGYGRRAEVAGAILGGQPASGSFDLTTFEFTAKTGFTATTLGIRRLILVAGSKADTLLPTPSTLTLQINADGTTSTPAPTPPSTTTAGPNATAKIVAALDRTTVSAGGKVGLILSANQVNGLTKFSAEVLFDLNALEILTASPTRSGFASLPLQTSEFTGVSVYNRRSVFSGSTTSPITLAEKTDLVKYDFTAKAGFSGTSLGIRWLVLGAGTAIDTVFASPSPLVLPIYAETGGIQPPGGQSKALAVSVSNPNVGPGQTGVEVSIAVDDATGIAGADLTLTYASGSLTAREVRGTPLVSGLTVVSNLATPGQVKVSMAGVSGIASGSGALLTVVFDVKAGATAGTSDLGLQALLLDAKAQKLSSTVQNGRLTVQAGPTPGAGPRIALSATSMTFDSTAVGATSQKALTIKNAGNASLSVTNVKVTGADSSQFTVFPTAAAIAAGDSAKMTVTFAPASAGVKSAFLWIAHNAAGSPSGAVLRGVGAPISQPPPTSTVPEPFKQDTTKLGVWLDLNTASGNQYQSSGSALPGAEIKVQVFGRYLTSATSFGVTLAFDPAALTYVANSFQLGPYLANGTALSPQVGTGSLTLGAAILGGSPVSGSGLLATLTFKTSGQFTSGYTEIKVSQLKLGTPTVPIQPSSAIVSAFRNSPPVAKLDVSPDAIKAGDTKSLVTLDAAGSSDPDGDPITIRWSATTGLTFKKSTSDTSRIARVALADTTKSSVTFTLTVTDRNGARATATQTLKVIPPPDPRSAVAIDLDAAEDNQNTTLKYGVKPGDTVTLQVFVKDLSGATGYTVKVSYDTSRAASPTYAHGPLIAGAAALPPKVSGGVIEGGASILSGTPVSGSGLLATFTFQTKDTFEGTTALSAMSVNLQMGTSRKELVTGSLEAQVTADVPVKAGSPAKFTDSPEPVGFDDFFMFAMQFNTRMGDPSWDARFDLTGDGVVDFEDFFAFAAAFGLVE